MTKRGTHRGWTYDVWAIRSGEGRWIPKALVWREKDSPRTAIEADSVYPTREEAEANAEKAMAKWIEEQR